MVAAASPNETVYEVGPLDRALDILDQLGTSEDLSLGEIAEAVALSKSTTFRHLTVLARRGHVIKDPITKRYSLGYGLLKLGYLARKHLQLPKVARPGMESLAAEFNETVHLGVLMDAQVVHIAVIPSTHVLKMDSEVGERAFVHASALGKCLIAWAAEDERARVISETGLPQLSARTITTPAALDAELQLVRNQGYAMDNQEAIDRLRCIGAPIRGAGDEVVAAVSVSGPIDRVTKGKVPRIASATMAVADHVGRLYGR